MQLLYSVIIYNHFVLEAITWPGVSDLLKWRILMLSPIMAVLVCVAGSVNAVDRRNEWLTLLWVGCVSVWVEGQWKING